jgi:hypothetical protein
MNLGSSSLGTGPASGSVGLLRLGSWIKLPFLVFRADNNDGIAMSKIMDKQ